MSDDTDLVTELRKHPGPCPRMVYALMDKAADAVERLSVERDSVQAELERATSTFTPDAKDDQLAELGAALIESDHRAAAAVARAETAEAEVRRYRDALDALLRTHTAGFENEPGLAARRVAIDLLGGYEAWAGTQP